MSGARGPLSKRAGFLQRCCLNKDCYAKLRQASFLSSQDIIPSPDNTGPLPPSDIYIYIYGTPPPPQEPMSTWKIVASAVETNHFSGLFGGSILRCHIEVDFEASV